MFILAIIGSGIGALIVLIGGIAGGGAGAFVAIILSPNLFFLYVILARVWLEVIIVMFRIEENTSRFVEMSGGKQETSSEEHIE